MSDLFERMERGLRLFQTVNAEMPVAFLVNEKTYEGIKAFYPPNHYADYLGEKARIMFYGIEFLVDETIPDGEVKPMTQKEMQDYYDDKETRYRG